MSTAPAVAPRLFDFIGGTAGPWRVLEQRAVVGEALEAVSHLHVAPAGADAGSTHGTWRLRGITSNERYVERAEKTQLFARQPALGRAEATCAALIPIRKTAAWWTLTQDERRGIFEAQSRHIGIGLAYLPAVARRLHHCRDLGEAAPFDFLTWFEYAPADAPAFESLVQALRASPEWNWVDRELDIRLRREGG